MNIVMAAKSGQALLGGVKPIDGVLKHVISIRDNISKVCDNYGELHFCDRLRNLSNMYS
jgi:hypothetical protein